MRFFLAGIMQGSHVEGSFTTRTTGDGSRVDRGPFPEAEVYDPLTDHARPNGATRPAATSSSTTTACAAKSTP